MENKERSRVAEQLIADLNDAIREATSPVPVVVRKAALVSPRELGISFTAPLLRAVLAGSKTQTRRPIRPQPAQVIDGVALSIDGSQMTPPCTAGGRMWVREKWARTVVGGFVYALDEPDSALRWISSRFMPRAAARHFLLIESVTPVRLSSIDDPDAIHEGSPAQETPDVLSPREWFMSAWDAIYADREFASKMDPWVWKIEFTVVPGT